MQPDFISLFRTSLRQPDLAAEQVIGWQLGRDVLWMALALAAIIGTGLVVLVTELTGPMMALPIDISSPIAMFVVLAGTMVVYIHLLYWTGAALGGQGTLNDVLSVVIWFQFLRIIAQVTIVVVSLALPALGLMLSFVLTLWGLWIFLSFLKVSLKLGGIGHAMMVLIVSGVGLVLGLGILMSLIGIGAQGVS